MLHIVNQDRDAIWTYNKEDVIMTAPVFHYGVLMGINVILHDESLGTFDSIREAIEEVTRIITYCGEYYWVRGTVC